MEITPNKIEEVLEILKNRTPTYGFQWNVNFEPLLGDEFPLANQEYVIYYKGNLTTPYDFKFHIKRAVIEILYYFKKQKYYRKITNGYLQILVDELTDTINTFEHLKIREKEFQFQADAVIWSFESDNLTYYKIEDIPDYFLDDVAQASQLKYDYTIDLINGLKKILELKEHAEQTESEQSEEHSETTSLNEISKLEMNLSVPTIALLYRLLDEEKIFKYKCRTEIYRHISSTLKSLKQDNISAESVANKFLSPDPTAIKNLEILISNLRQHLKKIKE